MPVFQKRIEYESVLEYYSYICNMDGLTTHWVVLYEAKGFDLSKYDTFLGHSVVGIGI